MPDEIKVKQLPIKGRMVRVFISAGKDQIAEECAAIVAHVHNADMINACVFRDNGNASGMTSIPRVGTDAAKGSFCAWEYPSY